MNFKTTLALLVLVALGGMLWWRGPEVSQWLGLTAPAAPAVGNTTVAVLENELTPDRITRIQVKKGEREVVLERGPGGDWTLPGKWPARPVEVKQLVELLTGLRSRFVPFALDNGHTKNLGLDKPAVTVTVQAGGKDHRLEFGEEEGKTNRFSRSTFLRVDNAPEAIRLAPGLVAALDRPTDYYHQRRLFLAERVKAGDSPEKTENLLAQAVAVKGPSGNCGLAKSGDDWTLREPVTDRVDPDKLKTLLTAVPDIWAEVFDEKKKDLAEFGLKEPAESLTVTRPGGQTLTLVIGKEAREEKRQVMKQAPQFGGPPQPPHPETIITKYRYAKLKDNDQVFEIKADRLKDVFVAANTLRDANLARFKTEDVKRLVIAQGGKEIVLVKDKERWRLQKPIDADAESSKVTELLDKLSNLQARDKDILDKADPKAYGLDAPAATITVHAEESKGEGDKKTKVNKAFTFTMGKEDKEKAKLYVRVEGWGRVNAVETSIMPLVKRSDLAYRGRRVLDFFAPDLAKVDVQRGSEKFTLQQEKDVWRLAAPVPADADGGKVNQLAGDLGRVEAVEFVTDNPQPADLDKQYGLAKPALAATVTFTQKDKPAQTLVIGKQRGDKPEYFAKLGSSPAVFVVKKEVRDALDQGSLAYRPLQPWSLKADDVTEVRILRDGHEERLKRDGQAWHITEPFGAAALTNLVQPMIDELAGLKAERYEAHTAKDPKTYGLDQPHAKVVLIAITKKDEKQDEKKEEKKEAKKETPQEHILLIGKPTAAEAKTRFAKLAKSEAIFVVSEKLAGDVDRSPLDLLDRKLLALDTKAITRLRSSAAEANLVLQQDKGAWHVVESPAARFTPDHEAVNTALGVWSNLQADRFVAYGPKVNLAVYGLDKPVRTLTVSTHPAGNDKAAKGDEHTLVIGKPADGVPGGAYARLDKGPGVAILSSATVGELNRTYLDFVDRTVLKLDAGAVTALQRKKGAEEMEVAKHNESWQVVKPAAAPADGPTLDGLVEEVAALRAKRVAAYPAKDLKSFGLDTPEAIVTLHLTSAAGKKFQQGLRLGKAADTASGERYAMAEGSTVVAVIPGSLAKRLLAAPLAFRDHNLARFTDVDRAILKRGPRQAQFTKVEGTWKMTGPLEAEADHGQMEDFINTLARLRVDELVADKPADLKPYGLDQPEIRWQFQLDNKDQLGLLIGKLEKNGTRRYAKLTTGDASVRDLVFLLDTGLSGKVAAEYRIRTVWPSLDAAQIETVRFSGNHPFILEKLDNTWHVAGQPLAKVKSEAVTKTLDALARLKAERFVVDRGADLKFYGLEPPQLTVEVQTPSGKRLLEIGRAEGDSKRHYARVPEVSRSEVFLIAEADAQHIVRPLAAYLQGAATSPPKTTQANPKEN